MIPLVIRKCLRSLLLNYLSKLYYSSELFPALPLSLRRGGRGVRLEGVGGVRLFLVQRKREDVKSSFTSSLLGYILFLVPLLSTPHYLHIHKDIVVSAPLLRGKELGRVCWATFYITVLHRLDGCCTSQTFLVCFLHFYFQQ